VVEAKRVWKGLRVEELERNFMPQQPCVAVTGLVGVAIQPS
jgi:hypothetical protein